MRCEFSYAPPRSTLFRLGLAWLAGGILLALVAAARPTSPLPQPPRPNFPPADRPAFAWIRWTDNLQAHPPCSVEIDHLAVENGNAGLLKTALYKHLTLRGCRIGRWRSHTPELARTETGPAIRTFVPFAPGPQLTLRTGIDLTNLARLDIHDLRWEDLTPAGDLSRTIESAWATASVNHDELELGGRVTIRLVDGDRLDTHRCLWNPHTDRFTIPGNYVLHRDSRLYRGAQAVLDASLRPVNASADAARPAGDTQRRLSWRKESNSVQPSF